MTNINGLFIATLASLVVVFVLLVWKMRTTPPVEPRPVTPKTRRKRQRAWNVLPAPSPSCSKRYAGQ